MDKATPPRRRWFQFGIVLLLLTLAALPLPIYPGVLVAGIMGIAGNPQLKQRPIDIQRLGELYFFVGGIAYPLIYFGCAIWTKMLWPSYVTIVIAAIPLLHLCGLLSFFALVIWKHL
jgi:hypothetical protein